MDRHFASLVIGLAAQAEQALDGTLKGLPEGAAPRDVARELIDTLAMLEARMGAALDADERRLLTEALTSARFKFVRSGGAA